MGEDNATGGLVRERLSELVARNLTVREIAAVVGRSPTTVRYWLRVHGLTTSRSARLRVTTDRAGRATGDCPRHGPVEVVVRREGGHRCVRCRAEQVSAWRRRMKLRLVAEAGGACRLCGYDRCVAALQFHHLDPSTKRFHLAGRGLARSLASLRAEAAKCILLCANCHAEVESGLVEPLPPAAGDRGTDG